jgi:arylsulfatase A-like enzyme
VRRPNIVLIQAESLDGRALGCMGEAAAHTPNLDRLAARGVVFDAAYCNSPQCCPSRSSMWAGRYVFQVGAFNNFRGLPDNEHIFTRDLEAAGYRCAVLGRIDHRSGAHSVPARLSAWVRSAPDEIFRKPGPRIDLNDNGRRQRAADWVNLDEAQRWITEERDRAAPFFLHLGLGNTHPGAGYNTSHYWLDLIDPEAVSMPPRAEEAHPVMQRMQVAKRCDQVFDEAFVHTCRRHYLAMIAEVDGLVGDLLETLEREGVLEDTIVVFTADHGDMRLEHGQYLKNALYEASARVPLVVAGPGIGPGHREARPVSLVDLYPTLLDWAGTGGRDDLAGHSLAPLAAGEAGAHPGIAFSEYHSNMQPTGSFMLREGPWKYIAYAGYRPQLFNLEEDPDEADDRAQTEPAIVARMDAALREIVDCEAVDAAAKQMDAAELAVWRLGHPGETYLDAMGRVATHWDDEAAARFADWADATGTAPERMSPPAARSP